MVDTIRNKVVVLLVALVMMFAAFASFGAGSAQAHGGGHYAADYGAWLAECYYGGYSWYDYYYHNGNYYWDWC